MTRDVRLSVKSVLEGDIENRLSDNTRLVSWTAEIKKNHPPMYWTLSKTAANDVANGAMTTTQSVKSIEKQKNKEKRRLSI